MAITKGAAKAHRASLRKRVFNLRRRRSLNAVLKDIATLIQEGKTAEAEKQLPSAYKAIDKAQKRGLIKKNNASRKKSRLVAAIRRTEEK